MNSNGTLKWEYKTDAATWTQRFGFNPTIGPDGTIYVTNGEGEICALSSEGLLKWHMKPEGFSRNFYAPAISNEGFLYVSDGEYLYSFYSDGRERWRIYLWYSSPWAPAIGKDRTIYATGIAKGDTKTRLHAVTPDGTIKWSSEQEAGGSPSLSNDGTTVYFTSRGGLCSADSSTGHAKWFFIPEDVHDNFSSEQKPLVGTDGTIYVDCYFPTQTCYAINPDGSLKWKGFIAAYISGKCFGQPNMLYIKHMLGVSAVMATSRVLEYPSVSPSPNMTPTAPPTTGPTPTAYSTLWECKYETPDYDGGIVVGSDGTIYAAGEYKIYAFAPDGTKRWDYTTILGNPFKPAIGSDGTIYVSGAGVRGGKLYAFDSNGALKWEYDTNEAVITPSFEPTIGPDGTIYVRNGEGEICALSPDGALKWHMKPAGFGRNFCTPAISNDGSIYTMAEEYLYSFDSNGQERWRILMWSDWFSTPVIGEDGIVYVQGSSKGDTKTRLHAITPNGTIKWSSQQEAWGSPSLSNDRTTVYFASQGGLCAIDAYSGTMKWFFSPPEEQDKVHGAKPLVGQDGIIYVRCSYPTMTCYAVNPDGSLKWKGYLGSYIADRWVCYTDKLYLIHEYGILALNME